MTKYPKVSVVTTTYNQQEYIVETLQGVFAQCYPGIIEFIISNDCSTDKTDTVIKSYLLEKIIPENFIIKYFCHDINKGVNNNFTWSLKQITGKYVALCEGDDYWINPYKLQKQVTVLENNPEVKICSHPSKRRYGSVLKEDEYGFHGNQEKIISVQQIIKNYASSAPYQSIVFKNENIEDLTLILNQLIESHSTIQIFYSFHAGLIYVPDYMAVYRVESIGSVSRYLFLKDRKYLKKQIKIWSNLDLLNFYSNFKFNNEFTLKKKQKAIVSIYSDNLSAGQILFLFIKYRLFVDKSILANYLKSRLYLVWMKLRSSASVY